ncbi:hypothetical protein CMI37_18210 [Candidatus Pacearchaeota archaeon]|nr:hypothetical protein [Candidatus Pacearchaeota archaeon]
MKKNKPIFSAKLVEKINNRELVRVRISKLKTDPNNPPERVATNRDFLTLRKGVSELGVLDTIHFCGDTMLKINGHRRVEAARQNGITHVIGYRYDDLTEEERSILFRHLNETSLSLTGSQKLHIFLNGGLVDTDFEKACHDLIRIGDSIKSGTGMKYLETIRNRRKSPRTFMIGVQEYCKVVDNNSMKTKSKVLDWMINVGTAHRIKALVGLKCPARLLKKAVDGKKPVMGTWEITAV